MRNPVDVLTQLGTKACDQNYRYRRLYRNFYNPGFYLHAQAGTGRKKHGEAEAGPDTAALIQSMQDGRYQPQDFPPSANALAEEVMRMLLEAIWEPTFLDSCHGFRSGRNCHTALAQVQKDFKDAAWFIEGNLQESMGCMDRHILADLVEQRVDDGRFMSLLWKFMKAGCMERWDYTGTYSGTPRAEGIGPILSNICLNELDQYMQSFICVRYVRYAGSFLIGVDGRRKDAQDVRDAVQAFIRHHLNLNAGEDKLTVIHGRKFAHFLGYDVTKRDQNSVALYVPKNAWVKRLQAGGALKIKMVQGKEVYEPTSRPYLLHKTDHEILEHCNTEIRSLYNYYRLANNTSVLTKYFYVMKYSLYKTLAAKHRTKISKVVKRHRDGRDFAVCCEDAGGGHRKTVLYNDGFARDPRVFGWEDPDRAPYHHMQKRSKK